MPLETPENEFLVMTLEVTENEYMKITEQILKFQHDFIRIFPSLSVTEINNHCMELGKLYQELTKLTLQLNNPIFYALMQTAFNDKIEETMNKIKDLLRQKSLLPQ